MNNRRRLAATGLLLMLAPACSKLPPDPPPLAGARIGGPFILTDQDGKRFPSTKLAGRYVVMYFGYTFCPDVCPTDMGVIAQGLKAFAGQDAKRAAKVQPVFVTVDPRRDTPAVIKQFVANFPPAIGLTGTPAEIAAMAKRFAVIYRVPDAAPGKGYLVEHSRMSVLFGPDLKPIAILPSDESAAAVAKTLDQWVK